MPKVVYDNSGYGPLKVPGFSNISIIHDRDGEKCFSANDSASAWIQKPRVTAREIAMLKVMSKITDTPGWEFTIFNEAVVECWKKDAQSLPLISQACWEWCVAEMRDKALVYRDTGHLLILDVGTRVYKSQRTVPKSIQNQLKAAIPALKLQQHGSDMLIDPSLFLLNFKESYVLTQGGRVTLDNTFNFYGQGCTGSGTDHHFEDQWLPCEVEFIETSSGNHSDVRITSYINNLHPIHHKSLYGTIEHLISLAIEPWNKILIRRTENSWVDQGDGQGVELHGEGRVPMRIRTFGAHFDPPFPTELYERWESYLRRKHNMSRYNDVTEESLAAEYKLLVGKIEEYLRTPENGSESAAELLPNWKNDLGQSIIDKAQRICKLQHPEPGISFSYEDWKLGKTSKAVVDRPEPSGYDSFLSDADHTFYDIKLQETFKEGLQVIVGMSNIELTPGKSSYPGTGWVTDGMQNDCIVATAVFFFDVENITKASISFEQATDMCPEWYPHDYDDYGILVELFGLENDEPALNPAPPDSVLEIHAPAGQKIGSTAITESGFYAWSNAVNHRFEPFKLADSSRPGHCRAISLWLVDPHNRVCSTLNVPPQQPDWWAEVRSRIAYLFIPQFIQDLIIDNTSGWPMTLGKAKRLRSKRNQRQTDQNNRLKKRNGTILFSREWD